MTQTLTQTSSRACRQKRQSDRPVHIRRRGSALLLTLLVTSLLLILTLAMVAMVRLELRQVAEYQERTQAQSQARLGLNLAVARLQHLAGADTRVTANADVLRGDRGNLYRPDLTRHEQTRYFTGVWDAASFDERDPAQKTFLGWLVSNGHTLSLESVESAPPADWELLVSENQVARASDVIRAPRVEHAGQGAYAWWVGDEGVKARFNLHDPHRERPDLRHSLAAAQRHGAEMLTLDHPDELSTLAERGLYDPVAPSEISVRNRLASLEQLPFLSGGNTAAFEAFRTFRRQRFHDVTLWSRGLLTDTREGGLRRDLTLAFEMPLTDFRQSEYGADSPHAFSPPFNPSGWPASERIAPVVAISDFDPYGFSPDSSPAPGGANTPPVLRSYPWHHVRNFYRLYMENDPDRSHFGLTPDIHSGGVYNARSAWPINHDFTMNSRMYGQESLLWSYARGYNASDTLSPMTRPVIPRLSPLVTRFQTVVSLKSVYLPQQNRYRLDVYLDPIVTLYNPYTVPIRTGTGASPQGQDLQLHVYSQDIKFFWEVNEPPNPGIETGNSFLHSMMNIHGNNIPVALHYNPNKIAYTLDMNVPGGLVMEPGEVVVFSPQIGEWYRRDPPDGSFIVKMQPGLNFDIYSTTGILLKNGIGVTRPAGTRVRITRFEGGHLGNKLSLRGVGDLDRFFGHLQGGTIGLPEAGGDWIRLDSPELVGKKPIFMFDISLKTEEAPDPVNLLTHYNLHSDAWEQGSWDRSPRSNSQALHTGNADVMTGRWYRFPGDWNTTNWLSTQGRNGFWGPTLTSAGNHTHIPLFDVPRAPMLSLAGMRHMPVSFMIDDPGQAIGRSHPPLFLPPDQKLGQHNVNSRHGGSNRMTRADWPYLMNEQLWDRYFFSGLASPDTSSGDMFTRLLAGDPLPNTTLSLQQVGGMDDADASNRLFGNDGLPRPDAHAESAAWLGVEGAFNVNSTSVEAWRALLSATRGLALEVQSPGGSLSTRTPGDTLFSRSLLPFDRENVRWSGFRTLTEAQIDTLARNIVEEIRVRGPFLNLGDFVNRRLMPDNHPTQQGGPLQVAIDLADFNSHFNRTLTQAGAESDDFQSHTRNNVDLGSQVAMDAPGYFNQADLLSVIGPLLSARSDTFTVRAFGESPGGARAWIEAVVQRVPDYVDSSVPAAEPPSWAPWDSPAGSGYDTATPRRRFVIRSFRWLGEDEI